MNTESHAQISGLGELCNRYLLGEFTEITGGTPQSNGLVSNQPLVRIYLKGDLTIDQNFIMNSWLIKADPGVSINIDPGVTLEVTECFLFSCTGMWGGIVPGENAVLDFNLSRVDDAVSAITCAEPGIVLKIDGNTFNRNQTGITFDYGNVPNNLLLPQILSFTSNSFTCTSPRNDGPASSDAGVYADDVLITLNGQYTINTFENQDKGIHMVRSNAFVKACAFENCSDGIFLENNSRLYLIGLGKDVSKPTFWTTSMV